jgi:hypothetical protein
MKNCGRAEQWGGLRYERNSILPFGRLARVGRIAKESDELRECAAGADHEYAGRMAARCRMSAEVGRHGVEIVCAQNHASGTFPGPPCFHATQLDGIGTTCWIGGLAIQVLPAAPHISIDISSVFRIERDHFVEKRQRKGREMILQHFRRVAVVVEVHHMAQPNPVAG